jgi:hypothetical protein
MFNLLRTKFYPGHDSDLEPPTLFSRFSVLAVRMTATLPGTIVPKSWVTERASNPLSYRSYTPHRQNAIAFWREYLGELRWKLIAAPGVIVDRLWL